MKKVITISRQYASGGRTIGKMVAQKLGIPLYDSEIIKDTMKKTGLSEKMVEAAEHEIIQEYVKKGPCVIVGRSANFLLNEEDSLNVYIYSDVKN